MTGTHETQWGPRLQPNSLEAASEVRNARGVVVAGGGGVWHVGEEDGRGRYPNSQPRSDRKIAPWAGRLPAVNESQVVISKERRELSSSDSRKTKA